MTKLPLTLAVLVSSLALTSPAYASHGSDDGRVQRSGSCSDGARWKLKVKSDDGRLEVEGEVDSNRSGQSWSWKIKDDGTVAAKGSATTGGRSGSFSVERKIADRPGTDTVTFRARHGGEVCSGSVAF